MSYPSASGAWNNPPPPGTMDNEQNRSSKDTIQNCTSHGKNAKENYKRYSRSRSGSSEDYRRSQSRSYSSRSRSYSRSRSRDWHLSRSYDRNKRSRSKEYRNRRSNSRSSSRRRYSYKRRNSCKSSRRYSRSRSRSYSRHHRRSYSRSRSRSLYRYSRSRSNSWSSSSCSDKESPVHRNRGRKYVPEVPKNQEYIRKVYSKQNEVPIKENSFKNDGSFLEMFKKMQEEQKAAEDKKVETNESSASEVKKSLPIFGKRRGGRILKTGMVQKLKNPNEVEEEPKDAWSVYMKEVKRYKEACCDDDSKTRPLVK